MARKKNTKPDEIMELEQAFESLTGPAREKKAGSPFSSLLMTAVILMTAGLLTFCFFGDTLAGIWKLGDITVAGVNLQGMTRAEARQALTAATGDTYTQTDMVIRVSDAEFLLSPEDTAVQLDIEAALDAAFRQKQGQLDLTPYLNLNMAVIEELLSRLDEQYNSEATKTSVSLEGSMPSLEPGSDGACQTLVITMGTPQFGLDIDALRQDILSAYRRNLFLVRRDCSVLEPEKPDLKQLYEAYSLPPVDAVMDMKTFEITAEVLGYDFDLESALAQAQELSYGESMTVSFRLVAPQVTREELASLLYRDVLASYKTKHTWEENRNTNLRLACQAINGLVLFPGEQFGYNDTLGERTKEKGYKPAGAYVNGETVSTVGGGICQVSSTLYYCTLIADLQIDLRYPHSYVSSYIPKGMDATVSWGGPDFKFTNNTNYPIRIEAYVADGYVHVSIVGTDEKDYYVEMEFEVLDSTGYETVYKELPPDNEKGFVDGDVITTPYTGYKVKTYKCRYSKEDGHLISREFEADSNYKKRDKVVCKIVDPNAPTDETQTTQPTQQQNAS